MERVDRVSEVMERVGRSGPVYLVCACPVGLFTEKCRVDVVEKRVECGKCGGWKNVKDLIPNFRVRAE